MTGVPQAFRVEAPLEMGGVWPNVMHLCLYRTHSARGSTAIAGGTAIWFRTGKIPRGLDGWHASARISHRLTEAKGETDVLGEPTNVREPFECPQTWGGGLVAEFEASADIRVDRRLGQDSFIHIKKPRRRDVDGDRLLPQSG